MSIFNIANGEVGSSIRTKLNAKLSSVIDVKADFGALGNGSADDTTALQNALDAAFGTISSPNGLSYSLNHPVYFPPGNYIITKPLQIASTWGAHIYGAGRFTTTIDNTTDGSGGSINVTAATASANVATFTLASAHGQTGLFHVTVAGMTPSTYNGSWQARSTGTANTFTAYLGSTPADATGMGTVVVTSLGTVFITDGMGYSVVERMQLKPGTGGIGFDNNWSQGTVASQSNTFSDLYVEGGEICMRFGQGGQMCSENLVLNCWLGGATDSGLKVANFNSLANSMIGGNIYGCAYGIYVGAGACPVIHGVSFQQQTTADIGIFNSAGDMYSIKGCRNENNLNNTSFLIAHGGATVHVAGCSQLASGTGIGFAFIEAGSGTAGPGCLSVDNCYSPNGIFTGNGFLYIRGNPAGASCLAFGNANYLTSFTGTVVQNI